VTDAQPAVLHACFAGSLLEDVLDLVEGFGVDDHGVHDVAGDHPVLLRIPARDTGVAHRNVLDVEENLIGALPVPHLPAGVAGIGQDGANGGLGPRRALPMRAAGTVVGRRARDSFSSSFRTVVGLSLMVAARGHNSAAGLSRPPRRRHQPDSAHQ
jgi:hypothetical protein